MIWKRHQACIWHHAGWEQSTKSRHGHHSHGLGLQEWPNRNLQRLSINKCKVLCSGSKYPLQQQRLGLTGEQLWGSGGQWVVSEPVPWLQRRPTAYPISKSVANRSGKWLPPLFCTHWTASQLLHPVLIFYSKKNINLSGASPRESHQDAWEMKHPSTKLKWRDWGTEECSAWRRGSSRGIQQQPAPTYKEVFEMTVRLFARVNMIEGWQKTDMSWNKFKLNIMKKKNSP